ncbi:MAG: hypothetical protein WDW38_001986 [Sanguina aurantia]
MPSATFLITLGPPKHPSRPRAAPLIIQRPFQPKARALSIPDGRRQPLDKDTDRTLQTWRVNQAPKHPGQHKEAGPGLLIDDTRTLARTPDNGMPTP